MSDFKANDEADTVSSNAEANIHSFIHSSKLDIVSECLPSEQEEPGSIPAITQDFFASKQVVSITY